MYAHLLLVIAAADTVTLFGSATYPLDGVFISGLSVPVTVFAGLLSDRTFTYFYVR